MVPVQGQHLQTCRLSTAQERPPQGRVRTRIPSAFHSPHYVPLGKMEPGSASGENNIDSRGQRLVYLLASGESPAKMVSGSPQLPLLGPDHPRRAGQRGSFCRCWRNAVKRMSSRSTRTQRDVSSLPWPLLKHRQTDRHAHLRETSFSVSELSCPFLLLQQLPRSTYIQMAPTRLPPHSHVC